MYHPTTRVLTVLELLQARGRVTGPELAERLEVNIRTARRYITMLQDLGMPIEAERGRYGAYRLRPGFKLPPLMFTEDEALALTLGLLAARRMGLTVAPAAVEGALGKVQRVLPPELRERVRAVQETLVLDVARAENVPTNAVVVTLSAAAQNKQRVWLRYRAESGAVSEREFDPYGLVYRTEHWYTVGYCHLRSDMRMFRLERIEHVELREERFTRPEGFDALEYVLQSIAKWPNTWSIEVLLALPIEIARQLLPPTLALLEAAPEGTLLRGYTDDLDWMAGTLARLDCPLIVRHPPELRDALRNLAARIGQLADQQGIAL